METEKYLFQAWKTDDLKKMEKGFLAVRNVGKSKKYKQYKQYKKFGFKYLKPNFLCKFSLFMFLLSNHLEIKEINLIKIL